MTPTSLSLRKIAKFWAKDPDVYFDDQDIFQKFLKAFWSGDFERAGKSSVLIWTDENWTERDDAGFEHTTGTQNGEDLRKTVAIEWSGKPVTRKDLLRTLIIGFGKGGLPSGDKTALLPSIHEEVFKLHLEGKLYKRAKFKEVCRQLATVQFSDWPRKARVFLDNIAIARSDFVEWCESNDQNIPKFWSTPDSDPSEQSEGNAVSDSKLGPTDGWTEESLREDFKLMRAMHADREDALEATQARGYRPRKITGQEKISLERVRRLVRKL